MQAEEERSALAAAAAAPSDYVFPARLQEIAILQHAVEQAPEDARWARQGCQVGAPGVTGCARRAAGYAGWRHGGGRGRPGTSHGPCSSAASPGPATLQPSLQAQLAAACCAVLPDRSRYYLGCLLYDRRRYDEAVTLWEAAVALQPDSLPSAWRNLGIAYFNVKQVGGWGGGGGPRGRRGGGSWGVTVAYCCELGRLWRNR
jgi:tetratricopeptide (TPR) repeat protein